MRTTVRDSRCVARRFARRGLPGDCTQDCDVIFLCSSSETTLKIQKRPMMTTGRVPRILSDQTSRLNADFKCVAALTAPHDTARRAHAHARPRAESYSLVPHHAARSDDDVDDGDDAARAIDAVRSDGDDAIGVVFGGSARVVVVVPVVIAPRAVSCDCPRAYVCRRGL